MSTRSSSTVADSPRTGRAASSAGVTATLGVLDLLAAKSPLSLSEIARELGVPKSTLHRICAVLVERGWVRRASARAADTGTVTGSPA